MDENLKEINSEELEKENILSSTYNSLPESSPLASSKNSYKFLLPLSIVVASFVLSGALVYNAGLRAKQEDKSRLPAPRGAQLVSGKSVVLPIKWGDLGKKLVETGVIDLEKLESIYAARGGLTEEERSLFEGSVEKVVINENNAGFILNLLWAFGLSNKNRILEEGPMSDPGYGGPGNFASTGGWILAKGNAMDHYSRHNFIILTPSQQFLVEKVSQNIYRPCCNNSTYFPDCNHGMAMLGLLELMAANNLTEEEMYEIALQVNSLWFPDTYAAIEQFLISKGYNLNEINPKEILGQKFSSASGYRWILSQITPPQRKSGSSCGV